jgi:hypothetical protein
MGHNRKRLGHYERAGFQVDDAELLRQILVPVTKNRADMEWVKDTPLELDSWKDTPIDEVPWHIRLLAVFLFGLPGVALFILLSYLRHCPN